MELVAPIITCTHLGMDPLAKIKLVESLCKILETVGVLNPTPAQVRQVTLHREVVLIYVTVLWKTTIIAHAINLLV